jgi:DNA-binding transcriptional LysR family regulator
MNLDRLRTFRALSESLHFRRTADRLHLSQSAVSQQISTLEKDLGVLLVERIGRRVFLTPAGTLLAEEAGKILASIDRTVEAVRTFGAGDAGALRLGASTTPGVYIVPQALGALRVAMPNVQVAFRIDNSAAIEKDLLQNSLDLGIVGEDIAQEELFQAAIGEDVIIAVASPKLLRKKSRPRLRASDLAALPLLARESGSATQRHVDVALDRLGVSVKPAFSLPSPEAQVRAAAAGLGVAFVSRHVAAADLEAKRLVELHVNGLRLVRPISAAYHRDKRMTPAMQQLIDLIRNQAKPSPRRR